MPFSEELERKKTEAKTVDTISSYVARPTSIIALHMLVSFFVAGVVCLILLFKLLKWLNIHHEEEQLLTERVSQEEV